MNVSFETANQKLIVKIDGDIDHHTCEEIRNRVDQEIMKKKPRGVIFDMENVSFMDSSGVGVIIGRYKLVHSNGGTTSMLNVKPPIKRICEICGLQKIIPIYQDKNQAICG